MQQVPLSVRDEVVKLLYADADRLEWERLPDHRKAEQYQRWADDTNIGRRLGDYTSDVHGWIKEIPLKEYSRALEGLGRFAKFTARGYTPAEEFLPRLLGGSWSIVAGSVGDRPTHCMATNGSGLRYVCWGKPKFFKDLLWAALNEGLDNRTTPLIIVCLRSDADIEPAMRRRHEIFGTRCGIGVTHLIRPISQIR
ncbi:hypothetical protein [Catelliglobosispora koreensis]|uniref:hypothetical protein n=1 Tax=Catelliglobosispora koreensis TaxID=129052 RepID=UPI00035E9D1A|nr:hypothetical protein [Catelliglobosispora koreensis]